MEILDKSWKEKRIDAMNRVIKNKRLSTLNYLEEYDRVCKSSAKNKKQYKGERNYDDSSIRTRPHNNI